MRRRAPPGGDGRTAGAGSDARAALREAARRIGPPCVLTTVTTAAGFASFAGSELESFVRFGVLAASGVVFALLATFTTLPLALRWLTPSRGGRSRGLQPLAAAAASLARLSQRHAGAVVLVAALAGAGGTLGFASLRVEATFEDLYGRDSQVVRWARAAADHLREAETLEVGLLPRPRTSHPSPPRSAPWHAWRPRSRSSRGWGRASPS